MNRAPPSSRSKTATSSAGCIGPPANDWVTGWSRCRTPRCGQRPQCWSTSVPPIHTAESFERTIGLAAGLVQPRQGGGPTRLVTTAGLDSGPLATSARFSEVLAALASERPRPGPPPEALIERLPALRRCERVVIVTTPAGCPVTARPRQRTEYVVAEGPAQLRSNQARLGSLTDGTDPRTPLRPVPLAPATPTATPGNWRAGGDRTPHRHRGCHCRARSVVHGRRLGRPAGGRRVGRARDALSSLMWVRASWPRRGGRRVRPAVTLGVLGGVVGTAVIAGLVANGGHPGTLRSSTISARWAERFGDCRSA